MQFTERDDFSDEPPDPPSPPEELMAVGNKCDECGIEQGLFPRSNICLYCMPVEQPNGRVIKAVTYSPAGTMNEERLQTLSLQVNEDNTVTFRQGEHRDCEWINGKPTISTDGSIGTVMVLSDPFPPPMYHIYFADDQNS